MSSCRCRSAIPADYVADKNVRLGLYRRMADMRSLAELDALAEEFKDRFGPPPSHRGRTCSTSSKSSCWQSAPGWLRSGVEGKQIVLRYPEGAIPEDLPDLGPYVRVGKVALWLGFSELADWKEQLFTILQKLQTGEAVSNPA